MYFLYVSLHAIFSQLQICFDEFKSSMTLLVKNIWPVEFFCGKISEGNCLSVTCHNNRELLIFLSLHCQLPCHFFFSILGAKVWVKLGESLFYAFMKIICFIVQARTFTTLASVCNFYEGKRAVWLLAFGLLPNT